ncbi:hypothetical protein Y032_0563g3524 [Ancylostoma ceylanicum]|uniref:Uncharacterized protein n=1 Tax=Ancylostoma ceylanicum TaxID=53326 RepID=A0A016WPU6_9BILA|nr:hypothetical protein Y032_0563g3524 [Ancylostoma ceylanicum]
MYLCRGCKKVGKTTSIFVTGEDFTQDPETIGPTLCQYEERESDKANRMLYESYWYRVVDKIERMSWGGGAHTLGRALGPLTISEATLLIPCLTVSSLAVRR